MLLFFLALLPDFASASCTKGFDLDIPFDIKTVLNDELVTSWVAQQSKEERAISSLPDNNHTLLIYCSSPEHPGAL